MNIDRGVFAFAGCMVLLSLALGWFVSPWWLLLTAGVGRLRDRFDERWQRAVNACLAV